MSNDRWASGAAAPGSSRRSPPPQQGRPFKPDQLSITGRLIAAAARVSAAPCCRRAAGRVDCLEQEFPAQNEVLMESQNEQKIDERVAHPPPVEGLHVCLECDSCLAYPVGWEAADEETWAVLVRCPNCFTHRDGIFDQETVDRFDMEIDRGADQLLQDYTETVRNNMSEEIDRFVAALQADAILPEDF